MQIRETEKATATGLRSPTTHERPRDSGLVRRPRQNRKIMALRPSVGDRKSLLRAALRSIAERDGSGSCERLHQTRKKGLCDHRHTEIMGMDKRTEHGSGSHKGRTDQRDEIQLRHGKHQRMQSPGTHKHNTRDRRPITGQMDHPKPRSGQNPFGITAKGTPQKNQENQGRTLNGLTPPIVTLRRSYPPFRGGKKERYAENQEESSAGIVSPTTSTSSKFLLVDVTDGPASTI